MTLKKADLIQSIIENVHFKKRKKEPQQYLFPEFDRDLLTQKQATRIFESLIEIIKSRLEKGDNVLISGFGRFLVKFKWARRGRNPKTGEKIFINSHRTVTFRGSKKLKEKVNRSSSK
jgi:integration host factor subunit alpha